MMLLTCIRGREREKSMIKTGVNLKADGLNFNSITPKLGVELLIDKPLVEFSETQVNDLVQLAAERGVVIVRDQKMTPQQQADFAYKLGRPLTSPINKGKLPEELLLIQANEKSKKAAGTGWHSDVSSAAKPPGLSMLRLEIVPEVGGDTLFADMRQVFHSLSSEMRDFLEGLNAHHEPRGHYLYLTEAKSLEELPSVNHPVVRSHPLTGDSAIYVNNGFVANIVELTKVESDALLRMLYDIVAYSVDFHCRVKWEPNTVVFWDNRIVQHRAVFDYWPQSRRGYRVTIEGEAPIPSG